MGVTENVKDPDLAPKINKQLLHDAVVMYQTNARQGTAKTKTRGEVRGSTHKTRRQKGLGTSRQGGIRSPLHKGGGVVFGPQPRSHEIPFPKRMRRAELLGALSAKVPTLKVVDLLGVEAPKTKIIASMCGALGAGRRVLVVAPVVGSALVKSAANIPGLEVLRVRGLPLSGDLPAEVLCRI